MIEAEEIFQSEVFENSNELFDPYYTEFNIKEDAQGWLQFIIWVHEGDYDGSIIDYTNDANSNGAQLIAFNPYSESWEYDGYADGNSGEYDCQLEFSVEIVEE